MSNATLKQKVIDQAKKNQFLRISDEYLLMELYKLKPDHQIFIANPKTVMRISEKLESLKNETVVLKGD